MAKVNTSKIILQSPNFYKKISSLNRRITYKKHKPNLLIIDKENRSKFNEKSIKETSKSFTKMKRVLKEIPLNSNRLN